MGHTEDQERRDWMLAPPFVFSKELDWMLAPPVAPDGRRYLRRDSRGVTPVSEDQMRRLEVTLRHLGSLVDVQRFAFNHLLVGEIEFIKPGPAFDWKRWDKELALPPYSEREEKAMNQEEKNRQDSCWLAAKGVAQKLEDDFWKSVAAVFPAVANGDFPPYESAKFRSTILEAVARWLEINDVGAYVPKLTPYSERSTNTEMSEAEAIEKLATLSVNLSGTSGAREALGKAIYALRLQQGGATHPPKPMTPTQLWSLLRGQLTCVSHLDVMKAIEVLDVRLGDPGSPMIPLVKPEKVDGQQVAADAKQNALAEFAAEGAMTDVLDDLWGNIAKKFERPGAMPPVTSDAFNMHRHYLKKAIVKWLVSNV